MIRSGFLDDASRQDLIELARDGSAPHRLARRANALVLLDDRMSCEAVAKVLLLDDDTIRSWYRLFQEDGIEGGGELRLRRCELSSGASAAGAVEETLPLTTREVGAFIAQEFGIEYQGRSGLIMLLHRLGMEHRKPKTISRQLDPAKQAAFIKRYEWLARPGCRIKLHLIPAYCPHLDAIERLWGLMHRHVTHNKYYVGFAEFKAAVLDLLREQVPGNWDRLRDTDNFRVIDPANFRVVE